MVQLFAARAPYAIVPLDPLTADLVEMPMPEGSDPVTLPFDFPSDIQEDYDRAHALIQSCHLVGLRLAKLLIDYRPYLCDQHQVPYLWWDDLETCPSVLTRLEAAAWRGSYSSIHGSSGLYPWKHRDGVYKQPAP